MPLQSPGMTLQRVIDESLLRSAWQCGLSSSSAAHYEATRCETHNREILHLNAQQFRFRYGRGKRRALDTGQSDAFRLQWSSGHRRRVPIVLVRKGYSGGSVPSALDLHHSNLPATPILRSYLDQAPTSLWGMQGTITGHGPSSRWPGIVDGRISQPR